jgi:GH24 family phage-related lysozyme (muramidase)
MALGGNIEVDSGSYTPESLRLRRRLAETMLQQGMQTGPVGHWSQGLNRIVQAMLGGYQVGELERRERDQEKAGIEAVMGLLGPSTPAASAQPAMGQSPSAPSPAGQTTFLGEVGESGIGPGGFLTKTVPVSPSGGVRQDDGNEPIADPLALIRHEEGFAPVAQWDKRQYSGGYGSRAEKGETFTRDKAELYLRRDAAAPLAWVEANAPNASAQQKAALVSFGYNLGTDDLDKLKPDIQAGDWSRVGQRMLSFNKALNERTGKLEVMPGLVSRREREAALLTGGAGSADSPVRVADASGAMPSMPAAQAPAAAAPGVDMETRARVGALLANPATRQLGMAMVQQLALQAPKIQEIETRDQFGRPQKLTATYNPQTRRYEALQVGGAAPSASAPQDAQRAAPAAAASPPGGTPMLGGDDLVTSFVGEVGSMPESMRRQGESAQSAPAAPAEPSGIPGPAARNDQLGEGMMQRTDSRGRPLWQTVNGELQPIVEPKAAADERAKAESKRTSGETERQAVARRAGDLLSDVAGIPNQFGKIATERAIGPLSATQPTGTGYIEQAVNLPLQMGARAYGELNAAYQGGAAPTEVRDTIEQKMLAIATLTKPLVRAAGEGAWSDADQANLERLTGNVARARTVDEYNRRISEVKSTLEKAFGVTIPEIAPTPRKPNAPQTAEDAITQTINERYERQGR